MDGQQNLVFDNIVENMSDGMLVIGFDGKIRMENGIAAKLIGDNADTLCGKTMVELMVGNKENDQFFQCIIDAIFEKKKICKTVEYMCRTEKRYLRVVVSPLKDVEHNIALSVMFSDITDLMELTIKNEQLSKKLMDFVNNFVKVMVNAIETRTPYNATHTRKMVTYVTKYINWLESQGRGVEEAKKAPILASVWLHDIGKLVIPTRIMDKPDRLGEHRKDVLFRIETAVLCEKLKMANDKSLTGECEEKIAEIMKAKEIISEVNRKGYASEEMKSEIDRISDIKCLTSSGEYIPLLDEYEYEALCVTKGTLTNDERLIMQSHATRTFEMLMQMNLEGPFKDVPAWASKHHEYLDGSGYPNHITEEEIPWEVRILTIVDVYDALTAEDRPYKRPMTPEKAFGILESMADEGKIDKDILADFKESKAWA